MDSLDGLISGADLAATLRKKPRREIGSRGVERVILHGLRIISFDRLCRVDERIYRRKNERERLTNGSSFDL